MILLKIGYTVWKFHQEGEGDGKPCHWVEEDLCSACVEVEALVENRSERLKPGAGPP